MTAIIGKKFEDGVLILADKRVTIRGTQGYADDVKKIIVLSPKLILAYAGVKNIVDRCVGNLQTFAQDSANSLAEIIKQGQKLFCSALDYFKHHYPQQRYDTVYILAGFNDTDEPFIIYFSSDDNFQKQKPLELFYKTFPNKEMLNLRTFLINEVDQSRKEIPYYIQKFSAAVRMIDHPMVGKKTYSVYLSRNDYCEMEMDEYGFCTLHNKF
ncbi:Ntn hydrolase family protein [Niallia endozanthoxylica]|uniref:Proteasome subunit beta n=1 Tax=Niallia endozanthoxylica TaxID=2036016 RepID=A0A5J5I7J4_9BACI|nr:hypothetical protein [Niallia endozanthoxylica]KAA9032403.1 hypothetical protein F4V44_00410 [Niallia endozanthoxylica]